MRKEKIAIIVIALWLTIVSFLMVLTQLIDFEILFVLWFIGILVIIYHMEPRYVQPLYWRYFNYFIVAGIVIFGVIVVRKVMEILAK